MTPAPIDVAALRRLLDESKNGPWATHAYDRATIALHEAAPALLRAVEERDALLAAAEKAHGKLAAVDQDDGMSPWLCSQLAEVLDSAIRRAKEPQ